ncbi:4a-hydroxytetrahydrobiopterin dehydratase [Brucella haematophila]|uniref:4a-hydroxytetrahydrobiopterin dehydratase n=1 Tax=Brucella haematophila TaxID=419474 RepID=UPI00110E2EB8|nr:4a-hydroxytetrahydrobiopterin dehydratase [Brucella haematophila]TMV05104.1 4a-hydroxytetrahydrobiopterin dehydratase [Brucella haematophila]
MARNRLTADELKQALAELEGWQKVDDREAITKSFKFKDFNAAFGFMTRAALYAEKLDHHPEWFNVYNRVDVTLATHSENGITDLDIKMARKMNAIATS